MVAYSFKARFAEPIIAGTKGGTIRATRKEPLRAATGPLRYRDHVGGHAKPGEELQLYLGMRTKHCRLITRKKCLAVDPISLDFSIGQIIIGGLPLLQPTTLDRFARFDGFANFAEMRSFWPTQHFNGWHIRWLPL